MIMGGSVNQLICKHTKPTDLILTSVSLFIFQLDLINWSVNILTTDSFVAMENQLTGLGNSQIRNQLIIN